MAAFNRLKEKWSSKMVYKIYAFFACILILYMAMQLYLSSSYYSGILRDDLLSLLNQRLETIRGGVDRELGFMEQISDQIIWNNNLDNLLTYKSHGLASYSQKLYQVISDLRNIRQTQNIKFIPWVHISEADLVVSTYGSCDPSLFFRYYTVNGAPVTEELAGSYPHFSLHLMGRYALSFPLDSSEGIAFLRAIPSNRLGSPAGYIYINFDFSELNSLFRLMEQEYPLQVFILDQGDTLLYQYSNQAFSSDYAGDLAGYTARWQELSALSETVIGSRRYLVTCNARSEYGLRYIFLVPHSHIADKVKNQNITAMWFALLCLILGSLMSLLFASNIYSPIRKIVQSLLESADPSSRRMHNEGELSFISRTISDYKAQNSGLKSSYLRYCSALTESFFRNLLSGDEGSADSLQELLDISLPHK